MIGKEIVMRSTYILFREKSGDFIFTFRGSDEQLLLTSLSYTDKDSALRRINAMRTLAHRAESFLTCLSPDGKRYFLFRNSRQEILAQSEMFVDDESLLRAITAVRHTARTGKLLDRTTIE
jgi:uncharacterized protein YegP (UPF0339 family)